MSSAHASLFAAALGDELTESEASVRVFLTAGGLAILGCALLLFTIWWWRGTKPEPPALGPLEVMSDRRWHTASDSERRRLVEVNRPDAALRLDGVQTPEPIDLSVLAREQPTGFDDLRDDPARWPDGGSEVGPSADGSVLGLGPAAGDIGDVDEADVDQIEVEVVESDADVAETAVDQVEAVAVSADDDTVVDPIDPPATTGVDETMYQVEAPFIADEASNGDGDHHAGLDEFAPHDELDDHDDGDHDRDQPSDEMVIDPLLQRTASQD